MLEAAAGGVVGSIVAEFEEGETAVVMAVAIGFAEIVDDTAAGSQPLFEGRDIVVIANRHFVHDHVPCPYFVS